MTVKELIVCLNNTRNQDARVIVLADDFVDDGDGRFDTVSKVANVIGTADYNTDVVIMLEDEHD